MAWTNWSGYEKHLQGKAPRPVVDDLVAMKCHFPASHWRISYPHSGFLILSQEFLKNSFFRGWIKTLKDPFTNHIHFACVSCVGIFVDSSRRMMMSFEEDSVQLLSRYHSLAQNAYWAKGEFGRFRPFVTQLCWLLCVDIRRWHRQ